jgi:hypothetical protein
MQIFNQRLFQDSLLILWYNVFVTAASAVAGSHNMNISLGSWCGLGLMHLIHIILILSGQLHTYNKHFSTSICGWQPYGFNPTLIYALANSHRGAVGFFSVSHWDHAVGFDTRSDPTHFIFTSG